MTFNPYYFVSRPFLKRLAPFWVLCLVIGSLLPSDTKVLLGTHPGVRRGPHKLRVTSPQHKIFHLVTFGSTALLFLRISTDKRQELLWMFAVVALGGMLEIAQHLIGGNEFEWWDVRDDTYGVLAVFLGYKLVSVTQSLRVSQMRK
jgi:hypothetical protein